MRVVDSHIHCGIQNVSQPFSDIQPLLKQAGIGQACLFAPVEDIYERTDPEFDDDADWRECRVLANEHLLEVARQNPGVYPYYFVWNDFEPDDLDEDFCGIKWHHHDGEPEYHYDDPRCKEMIDAICERRLPIVLEETLENTLQFIERVAGRTVVIIPHLGILNGGFERLEQAAVWKNDHVYADTALAGPGLISEYLERHGADRLLFGSDWPFGAPGSQLEAIRGLGLGAPMLDKIFSANILSLISAGQ
jgi:predicted TIM-barrel fold metal-dependent hydrolase